MHPLLLALALGQLSPTVVVIDVSTPDAVYEDVSRGLAEQVVAALNKAGLEATRADESELPDPTCRGGPCLAKVATAWKALVLITLDATEIDKTSTGVALTALAGRNGQPLAGVRYTVGGKPPKKPKKGKKQEPHPLETFVGQVTAKVQEIVTAYAAYQAQRDAGR